MRHCYHLLLLLAGLILPLVGPCPTAVAAEPSIESAIEPVQQGFDLLTDRFVRPLASDDLLAAAWSASVAEATGSDGASTRSPLLTGSRERDWEIFRQQWLVLVSEHAARVEPKRLAGAALRGMAEMVDEGHTIYMDSSRYAEHQAWARGDIRYAGIGARIARPDATVIEVFEDSPAERSGLLPGDMITHVDGHQILGLGLSDTIGQVRGAAGTVVELRVSRPGSEEPLVLAITRAEIHLALVRSRMLPDEVGYLHLRGFPELSVVDRVQAALSDLRAQGARALVLDLRGNSGGRLDVGVRLLSLFVREGPLYQQVSRDGSMRSTRANPWSDPVDLPIVVLVDSGTASMGEIFASALQEHEVALLIGETTSGNVAAGQVFPLTDGSALQITVMEIRSGQGKALNGIGVTPDVHVSNSPDDLRRGHDAQLRAAVEHLAEPRFALPVGSGDMHSWPRAA